MDTKLFFDTEFTGLHQKTTLISLGIVSDDDRIFYAEFNDYDRTQVDNWLQKNVINNLTLKPNSSRITKSGNVYINGTTIKIRRSLLDWISKLDKIVMWSDCLSYDWVLINDLFGTALDIPKNISYIPLDICTMFALKGIDPDINREEFVKELITEEPRKHNALWDAYIIKMCHTKLMSI